MVIELATEFSMFFLSTLMVSQTLEYREEAGCYCGVQELSRKKHWVGKKNCCPGLKWVPFYLMVVKLRKQIRACEMLQREKVEMAYFLNVHNPIWLKRSVPSWSEWREEAFSGDHPAAL